MRIAPLLSGKASDCDVTGKNNRQFIEAVLWVCRTRAPWSDLYSRSWATGTQYLRAIIAGQRKGVGKSRGGSSTKMHAAVDALGNLVRRLLTAGQVSEYGHASSFIEGG